jgi:hypothetical protein
MKIHSTLPTNPAFFGYYARLIPTLFRVGFLSQLFSAGIETYILYAILRPKFEGVQAPGAAALLGALFLVVLLEVGLRTGAAFSVRAILHRKFSGLDLPMTVFILGLSGSLLLCSIVLHIEGAKEAVEVSSSSPAIESAAEINRAGTSEAEALLRTFSQDSATIAAAYAAKIRAAKIEAAAKERKYKAKKGATKRGAAEIRAKGEERLAALEVERAEKLQAAQERKEGRLDKIKNRQYSAADNIEARNERARKREAERLNKYGSYLSIFSVLTVVFFLLTIALNEIYKKGSGLEEVPIASQYQFEPGLLSKLSGAIGDKFQAHARRAIERIEEGIPAPRAPLTPHPLYDYAGLQPERLTIQTRRRPEIGGGANNGGSTDQSGRKQEGGRNGKHHPGGDQSGHNPGEDENGGLFVAAMETPGGGGGGNKQPEPEDNSANNGGSGSLAAAILGGKQTAANSAEKMYIERPTFTIEHNGKHYTLRDVNSFITTYTRRAETARKQGNQEALQTREEALQYWQERRAELLLKMQAAG